MDQLSLFDNRETTSPLASRIRPDTLDGFVGQKHLIGEGKVLRNLIEKDQVTSMIFWGPPGVGKTTLARIIAGKTRSSFIDFSAVTSGIKEIKTVMEQAEKNRSMGIRTILFVDEIHRFNKAQQDAFLPYVEKGSIILIGATTENPSFEINSALLSRCKVFVLKALTAEELAELLAAVVKSPKGFGNQHVQISKEQLFFIANFANGDARTALNTLEMAVLNGELDRSGTLSVTNQVLEQCTNKKSLLYDKKGEEHYNLISALHKSMRNSDPDAAVYWLARMLEAGEDPLYVARRLIRFASEDIVIADPQALTQVVAAYQAMAPKSNSIYRAYEEAKEDAGTMMAEPVPLQIRNAPTRLMADLHYGEGYVYAHETKDKIAAMDCLPASLKGREYYRPGTSGAEAPVRERLEEIRKWRREHPALP